MHSIKRHTVLHSLLNSKYISVLHRMEQPYMTVICRSIEDKFGALDFPPSHQSPQATSANQGQPKWTTQEEFHSNETAGADSSKESLLWSKSAVITSRLSWDAVSFFRNVGNSWPQQKLNVVLSFPSRLTALVEWEWNCKCLLWWFENLCLNSLRRGKHSMQDKKKIAQPDETGNGNVPFSS